MSKQQAKVKGSKVRREKWEEGDKLNFGVGAKMRMELGGWQKTGKSRSKVANSQGDLRAEIKLKKCL